MKNLLAFCISFIFIVGATAQKTYTIRDGVSEELIPFVKAFPNIGEPVLANLDGEVDLADKVTSVRLKAHGYIDSTYVLKDAEDNVLYMSLNVLDLDEVVALPGENPAHRIIKNAMNNRKLNHPLENETFQYDAYTKFLVETDEQVLNAIPDTTTDTVLIETRKFFSRSHLMIIESKSKRTFIPPYRDKEVVESYKVSGLSNPMFATIANQLQSFCFYENQVELAGKQYSNPIALGSTRRYLFILEDTTIVGADSIFHIRFRPFKNKTFNGMKGVLYINSNQWAIQKVQASGADENEMMQLEVIQEYEFMNDKYWFPRKLSSSLVFPTAQISAGDTTFPLKANSHTDIFNIRFNPADLSKRGFDNVNVEVASGANDTSEDEWQQNRTDQLTEKEQNTYAVIDSIAKEEDLDRLVKVFEILSSGKIPLGYLNIPMHRLLNYNVYEGFRLGFGLETSDKVSSRIKVGSYAAYGFRDRGFKYGASLGILVAPNKDFRLIGEYKNDLRSRGVAPEFDDQNLFSTKSLYKIYEQWMDREKSFAAGFQFRPKANFIVKAKGRIGTLDFLQNYLHGPNETAFGTQYYRKIGFKDIIGEVEWNLFQQYMKISNRYVPTRLNKPVFRAQFSFGENTYSGIVVDESYLYLKLGASWTHAIQLPSGNKFSYKLEASSVEAFTDAHVPMSMLIAPRSSLHPSYKISLAAPYSYQTLNSVNYFYSSFAGVITHYRFNPLNISDKFKPVISLHHAAAIGTRPRGVNHLFVDGNSFQSGNDVFVDMLNGHLEAGLAIDNIFNNLGVGFYYNYGSLSDIADPIKNFVIKLTINTPF